MPLSKVSITIGSYDVDVRISIQNTMMLKVKANDRLSIILVLHLWSKNKLNLPSVLILWMYIKKQLRHSEAQALLYDQAWWVFPILAYCGWQLNSLPR